jgi:type II secretory pathway pseudopilin PulG
MKLLIKNTRGYALVELLVYIGLVAIIFTIFTSFVVDVTKTAARVYDVKEVKQNYRLINSRITQEIKTAKQIVAVEPTQIILTDKEDNAVQFYYDSDEQAVYYFDGSEDLKLSSDSVIVSKLEFSANGNVIDMEIALEINNAGGVANTNYKIESSSLVTPRPSFY